MYYYYFASWGVTSITTAQDAHKRLVLQVAEWLTGFIISDTGIEKKKCYPMVRIEP